MPEQQPLMKIQATLYVRVNDTQAANKYIQYEEVDQFHLLSLNEETQTTIEIVSEVPEDVIVLAWTSEEFSDG